MIFNSFTFIIFLFFVTILYWLLPRGPRIWLLVISSIIFYGFWDFRFIPLLFLSIIIDYFAAIYIGNSRVSKKQRLIMIIALSSNLTILCIFKYLIFFVEQAVGLTQVLSSLPQTNGFSFPIHIILPLGISFYTFQSMSYTIDVWRGHIKPEREFKLFAAYVIFFPQLVAGPILRAGEVIWQLDKRPDFNWESLNEGLNRIVIGLFLKVFLADNLGKLVDTGFALSPSQLGGVDVLTLAFLFGFQIYFDFAGYSQIAIGCAKIMGITFPENFNFPYLARNPREFWKKWHISLSSWIRDYLYLPLYNENSGRKSINGLEVNIKTKEIKTGRGFLALWITWVVMGFWHGANWTFAFWGIWHASLITLYRIFEKIIKVKIWAPLSWSLTLVMVMIGWIPFRAESLNHTINLFERLFTFTLWLKPDHIGGKFPLWLGLHRDSYYVAASILLCMIFLWSFKQFVLPIFMRYSSVVYSSRILPFILLLPVVYLFLRPTSQFIYFQF